MVTAAGTIETSKLFNKLPDSLNRGIHGKSDWQLRLDFAGISVPKTKPFLRLSASSNLRNTRLDLPQPFAKTASSSRKASVELDFFQEQVWFSAGLGSDIRGRGQLVPDAERNFELNLLDIAFASKLKPKPQQGLHLYGSIDEVSVDDWIRFIKGSEGANSALLQSVDLSFDRALLFQRELTNASIELAQGEQSFVGSIDSSIVSGRFTAPWKPSPTNPLIVDLDYLLIEKVDDETEEGDLVPADLVDFRLDSKALVFHDMLFSNLHVDGRPVGDKLYIDSLGLQKDDLVLEGKGQWDYDAVSRSHLSSIAMTVRGENLGLALAGMGFGDSMRGGKLDFSGGFTWPERIVAFDVDNLVGDARFRVDDGVLNNVDPGGGRFVGLFSLAALPRRLSLDFSDVFIEGMEFDEIYGTYRIEKGILTTDDSRMKGPAADIRISGDTDIAGRSYDQTIEITPKIRHTLPVIGAVAAGSTVGWGLLLLQSLFKKSIDEAVEVEYRVSGSWDDPKIELVKAVDENQRELPKIDK